MWLDTKVDPNDLHTRQLCNQLNDRVQIFNDVRDCINILQGCQETILLISSGKCAEQHLQKIHSLTSIDSIIIFCAKPKNYPNLTTNNYIKILACISTEIELIQCVHRWIDLKCQTHFYIWNNQINNPNELNRQTALFLANYLLPKYIQNHTHRLCKQEMLNLFHAYYSQHELELNHVKEFELTYTNTDAITWYTRDSFVHKMVNRVLRSFDILKLRAIAFYIQDLRQQLNDWRFKTSSKDLLTVYHGLVMISSDINRIETMPIGSLLSTNGFLSTSRNREVAMAFAARKKNAIGQPLRNVLLEINLAVDNSPIIFADIRHVSVFPEEGEILFDIGTVLCLQNVTYDSETELYTIKLDIATQNDYGSIESLLESAKLQLHGQINKDSRQESLIGKLLNINDQSNEQITKSNDYLQTYSLFQSSSNSLWYLHYDKVKHLFEVYPQKFIELITNYFYQKPVHSKKDDLVLYNEPYLARFDSVLFFCLNDELMKTERTNLSSIFSSQYRRFITKDLTREQVEHNLNEFYYIRYIAPELPSHMKDNGRIKFYQLNVPAEKQNTIDQIKLVERVISRLLHDLGMFYHEQANSLVGDSLKQNIEKKLRIKAAECYQKLSEETEKTMQRYCSKDQTK
ncbi:unnamed protein product [Adineta steineri]|uniref:ADP ribosyltransferase domain-containing protein n=2 Tax=Adineta steineri TaxID=433720 RepID=A0A818R629_9BILA|nr:unnamed protein product [Adineta steineri]